MNTGILIGKAMAAGLHPTASTSQGGGGGGDGPPPGGSQPPRGPPHHPRPPSGGSSKKRSSATTPPLGQPGSKRGKQLSQVDFSDEGSDLEEDLSTLNKEVDYSVPHFDEPLLGSDGTLMVSENPNREAFQLLEEGTTHILLAAQSKSATPVTDRKSVV